MKKSGNFMPQLYNMKIRVLFWLLFWLLACRKSDRDLDKTLNSVEDNSLAESYFSHVFKLVDAAAKFNKGISSNTSQTDTSLFGCDQISVDSLSSPKKMSINFNSSCIGNATEHSGKITVLFYGKYNELGTKTKITFSNFKLNGRLIGGVMTITNNGLLINGNQSYSFEVSSGTVSGEKSQLAWQCKRKWEMGVGQASVAVPDDVYWVTGTAEGRAFKGNAFTVEITEALEITNDCVYITKGKCDVKPETLHTRRIDYGAGNCDAKAQVSINGEEYEVNLP
ncbi:MAG: hypothetical protein D8M18_09450 [Bacteroidetes bacterium]|nr:hypothetical protein [Bacteroidota bacterium]